MSNTNFPKYPKIYRLGHDETRGVLNGTITIEEKLDGSNFRFMLDDGVWVFGSRNTKLGNENDKIGGMFKSAVEYIKTLPKNVVEQIHKTYGPVVFYGENMVPHTIKDYYWDKMPPVIGFDIFSLNTGRFFDNKTKRDMFEMLGMDVVPLIYEGGVEGVDDYITIPKSVWRDGLAEGIVIKNYNHQIFAKVVDVRFSEENKKAFGSYKVGDPITDKYVTSYRVEKMILKLVDEGYPLDMTMMKVLPKAVYQDIIDEHGTDILWSNWVVDFKKTRKSIAKKCVHILDRMVKQNAVEKIRSNTKENS